MKRKPKKKNRPIRPEVSASSPSKGSSARPAYILVALVVGGGGVLGWLLWNRQPAPETTMSATAQTEYQVTSDVLKDTDHLDQVGESSSAGVASPPAAGSIASLDSAEPISDAALQVSYSDLELPKTSMPRNARELVLMRKEHDETVWVDEVKAQNYENTFVALWDNLLQQADKFSVLRDFAFNRLIVGDKYDSTSLDWDIHVDQSDGGSKRIDFADWPRLLAEYQKAGYRIIETEWHHLQFEPARDGNPGRSTVSMVMHVDRPEQQERLILKGNLKIAWASEPYKDSAGHWVNAKAGTIDATDVKIIHRQGKPAYAVEMVEQFDRDDTGKQHPTTLHPVILHDLNEDGLTEIIVGGDNLVYWNRGDWRFEKGDLCDFPARHPNSGIFADFTGDGVTDYLCGVKNGFPQLFEGSEGGRFVSAPRTLMIATEKLLSPTAITAGDIDGDGDLDVFIGQQKPGYSNGDIPTPYYDARDSFPSYLLQNDGHGGFQDVTLQAGLGEKNRRRNFSATFVDIDDDGDLDLLLTSDFSGTDMFYNDGHGHFTDVTEKLKPTAFAFGMSHTFGDYNLDGRLDFFEIGMSSTTARRLDQLNLGRDEFPDYNDARKHMGYGNRMYLYDGDNFVQAPFNASVARTGWSWGSTTLDFDCDGDQDVYVVNGQTSGKTTKDYCTRFWCHDVYYKRGERPDAAIQDLFGKMGSLFMGNAISWNGFEHNALLMNLDGKDFINVGFLMDVSFEFDSRCAVSGDLNGDGRIDLIAEHKSVRDSTSTLYVCRNQWTDSNHWIGVHLRQAGSGPSPLGAKVQVRLADGRKLLQHNLSGHSVWAQHANTVHFGLGKSAEVEEVTVTWPGGAVTELKHPAVDQYHVVKPPKPS